MTKDKKMNVTWLWDTKAHRGWEGKLRSCKEASTREMDFGWETTQTMKRSMSKLSQYSKDEEFQKRHDIHN